MSTKNIPIKKTNKYNFTFCQFCSRELNIGEEYVQSTISKIPNKICKICIDKIMKQLKEQDNYTIGDAS